MHEEPINATIVAWGAPAGLGVVYETTDGAKHARPLGAEDWPVIERLYYGGRLVFASTDLRYRYLEAAQKAKSA